MRSKPRLHLTCAIWGARVAFCKPRPQPPSLFQIKKGCEPHRAYAPEHLIITLESEAEGGLLALVRIPLGLPWAWSRKRGDYKWDQPHPATAAGRTQLAASRSIRL